MGLLNQLITTISQSLVFSFIKHCLISTALYLFNTFLLRHVPIHVMQRLLHPFGGSRGAYSSLAEQDPEKQHAHSDNDDDLNQRRSFEDYESSDDLLPAFRDTPRSSKLPWALLALVLIVDALFLSWLVLAITKPHA